MTRDTTHLSRELRDLAGDLRYVDADSLAATLMYAAADEIEQLRPLKPRFHSTIEREAYEAEQSSRGAIRREQVTLEKLRVAEAVRDDARLASLNDLIAKRRAFADGIRACVDIVEQRYKHYEMYRCDCGKTEPSNERGPGSHLSNGHRPGCKGEMMSTHPATFAILDEIRTFLLARMARELTADGKPL